MAEQEDVILKLGINGESFSQGLRGGLTKLNEFGREGEKSFLHVGSAGRAFHGVIEQISNASPIMGEALKFALNPMIGTLAAVALGAERLRDAIAEVNAAADAAQKVLSKPFISEEVAPRNRTQIKELNEAYQEFQKHRNAPDLAGDLVKRVEAETDAVKKLAVAQRAETIALRDRHKAEGDLAKAHKETIELTEKIQKIEGNIEGQKQAIEAQKEQIKIEEAFAKLRPTGLSEAQKQRVETAKDLIQKSEKEIQNLTKDLEPLNDELRKQQRAYQDAEHGVTSYDRAIKELQQTVFKLRGTAAPGSFGNDQGFGGAGGRGNEQGFGGLGGVGNEQGARGVGGITQQLGGLGTGQISSRRIEPRFLTSADLEQRLNQTQTERTHVFANALRGLEGQQPRELTGKVAAQIEEHMREIRAMFEQGDAKVQHINIQ